VRKDPQADPTQGRSSAPYVTPEELERLLQETDEAIAEWEAENGPIPEDVLAEVRAKWDHARPVR
jgi:hypothetical protein